MIVSDTPPSHTETEEFWRDFLTNGDGMERKARRLFARIPGGPRCRLCAAPFTGVGAPVMRMIGKRRSDKNQTMCMTCFTFLATHHGGAEIEVTLLFRRHPWLDLDRRGNLAGRVQQDPRPVLRHRRQGRHRQ